MAGPPTVTELADSLLADLYLEAGEPRRADAIEELQVLLVHAPDRVELCSTRRTRAPGQPVRTRIADLPFLIFP